MISGQHRFHGSGSLRFVHARGKIVRGPFFGLRYIYNSRRDVYRAAVVVSKKVSKSAVVRNRIRRRLYEALREHEPAVDKPYDMVFLVYSDKLADMPSTKLKKQVKDAMERAGIIGSKNNHN